MLIAAYGAIRLKQDGTLMYIHNLRDIPRTKHWAIITTSSHYIPGDERSRTNPGHGYPASTVTSIEYQAFTDQAKWKNAVQRMSNSKPGGFVALKVVPAKITVTTSVEVE